MRSKTSVEAERRYYRAAVAFTFQGRRLGPGKLFVLAGRLPEEYTSRGAPDAEGNAGPVRAVDVTAWALSIPAADLHGFLLEHEPPKVVTFAEAAP